MDADLDASARAAWPELHVAPEAFAAFVAERMPVAAARAADLYLACACGQRDPAAIAAFDLHYLRPLADKLARLSIPRAIADEAIQIVRIRLLVDGKIASYAGTGDLHGWLRVAALREAIQLQRGERGADPLDETLAERLPAPARDPASDRVKERYRAAFRAALPEALAELTARERNLIKLRYLSDLTIDQLAKLYRVHRATAARWANSASARLYAATRRRMRRQLAVPRAELAAILRTIQSQFDVSVRRLLDELS